MMLSDIRTDFKLNFISGQFDVAIMLIIKWYQAERPLVSSFGMKLPYECNNVL